MIICLAALSLHVPAEAAPAVVYIPLTSQRAGVPVVPSPALVLAMVRNAILAADQANKTGNYTVLRDLGSSNFHDTNDAARLAQIFAPIRTQGVDLLAVAVVDPQYKEPPRLTAKRMLYVAGQFPIAPHAVNFELLFEVVGGQWRIYGISISLA